MSVPDNIRKEIKAKVWDIADGIGWLSLSASIKSKYYKDWTRDPQIGGILSRFMDKGEIRVYLKDSIVKDYPKDRLAEHSRLFRILGIAQTAEFVQTYTKPHGRRLKDGRVICWGKADDWKSVLMALHERSFTLKESRPYSAMLLHPAGRFHEKHVRSMVEDAAKKLGIEQLTWVDT